jgi:hypothetical protein
MERDELGRSPGPRVREEVEGRGMSSPGRTKDIGITVTQSNLRGPGAFCAERLGGEMRSMSYQRLQH